MSDAILLRGGGEKPIHMWKKYEINTTTTYTWNRWNLVSTTLYKWNKWNAITGSLRVAYKDNNTQIRFNNDEPVWYSYQWNGSSFIGSGYKGTVGSLTSAAIGYYLVPQSDQIHSPTYFEGIGSTWVGYTMKVWTTNKGVLDNASIYGYSIISISTNVQSQGSTLYGEVTSTSSSAYPSNGASGSYWYVSAGSEVQYSKGSTQQPDVSSTSSTAYPDDGHDGSYWYDNKQTVIDYSMGNYIEDAFSLAQDTYPANGIAGSYWYVYQGKI